MHDYVVIWTNCINSWAFTQCKTLSVDLVELISHNNHMWSYLCTNNPLGRSDPFLAP